MARYLRGLYKDKLSSANISRWQIAVHDPWGHKRNRQGSICDTQYQVGKHELHAYPGKLQRQEHRCDGMKYSEYTTTRFVHSNNKIESLRS